MANSTDTTNTLSIDFSDVKMDEIEILVQEGSSGLPDFAASSCDVCECGECSCGQAIV